LSLLAIEPRYVKTVQDELRGVIADPAAALLLRSRAMLLLSYVADSSVLDLAAETALRGATGDLRSQAVVCLGNIMCGSGEHVRDRAAGALRAVIEGPYAAGVRLEALANLSRAPLDELHLRWAEELARCETDPRVSQELMRLADLRR
jgi:hypothetical protein